MLKYKLTNNRLPLAATFGKEHFRYEQIGARNWKDVNKGRSINNQDSFRLRYIVALDLKEDME